MNGENIVGMLAGYLKEPFQHQTYRHYLPVFCFVFHRTSCLWPVVSFLLAFGIRSYYMIIIIDFDMNNCTANLLISTSNMTIDT